MSREPTNVLTAILLPKIINASKISRIFIIIKIFAGEKGKKNVSITEIPLVPPKSKESGKMKSSVATAYRRLPNVISAYVIIPFLIVAFSIKFTKEKFNIVLQQSKDEISTIYLPF